MGIIAGITRNIKEFTDKLIMGKSIGQIEIEYPLTVSVYTDFDRIHCLICTVEFYANFDWIEDGADYCQACRSKVAHNLGRRIQNFLYYCYLGNE